MDEKNVEKITQQVFDYYPQIRKAYRSLVSIKELPISMTQLTCLHSVVANGTLSMSELAGELSMSNQQLTKVVDALVEFEMVTRKVDEKNRRKINVEATKKGVDTIEKLRREVNAKMAVISRKIPDEVSQSFVDNFEGITAFLDYLQKYLG